MLSQIQIPLVFYITLKNNFNYYQENLFHYLLLFLDDLTF